MSYDIFHLSYKEHYADETFKNLKYKFPWARRVQGVKGIFNAHKKCAEQAYTQMFYVVDADADLDDNFDLAEWIKAHRYRREQYQLSGSDGELNYKIPKKSFPEEIIAAVKKYSI